MYHYYPGSRARQTPIYLQSKVEGHPGFEMLLRSLPKKKDQGNFANLAGYLSAMITVAAPDVYFARLERAWILSAINRQRRLAIRNILRY